MEELIVQVIAGLVGGNVAGAATRAKGNGAGLNSILGAFGGLLGGQGADLLGLLQGMGLLGDASTSAVVGALLPLVVSYLRKPAS